MGFIRDFFDKQKAKSILNDYQSAIYLEDSVDNIKATLDDSEADIDKTFSRLAYFYLTDKIERNAINLISFFNFCRIKKLPLTSYDKWEGVVVNASKDLYSAINVGDVKFTETYICLSTYYLCEGKDTLAYKVLSRCPMEHSHIAYLRAVIEANKNDFAECEGILSPYANDTALIPMAKILLSTATREIGDSSKAYSILEGLVDLTVEERAEYLYLLVGLEKYAEIIELVKNTPDASHYDAYMVCVASYYLGKEVVETGIMDSEILKENAVFLSRETYSPYRFNEVRSNDLIEQMTNDELFDTATPEFRLMRQNEVLDMLQVFYNGVRYLEFLDTYVL